MTHMRPDNRRNVTIKPDLWRRLKVDALLCNLTVSEYITLRLEKALAEDDKTLWSDSTAKPR